MTALPARTVFGLVAALLGLCGLVCAAPNIESAPVSTNARAAEQGPRWTALKPAEQLALAPLQREWSSIGAERKMKWLEVASRFPSLSPAERERIQDRMTEWARLSPEERGRARLQFQEVRQLSPQDRQERWEAYQALPEHQRKALAAKASSASQAATGMGTRPAATSPDNRSTASAAKQNRVNAPNASTLVKAVEPTLVHAKPGATTTLVSRPATPPAHHQPGQPKIAATKDFVDPNTLLPTRGPQAAVAAGPTPAASDSAASSQ